MSQSVPLTAQEFRGARALAAAPQDLTSARKLADTIPVFSKWQKGNLLIEYTERGGKLIFHVYHTERKQLVNEALMVAEQCTDNPRHLQQLDAALADKLDKHPWWNGIGERLHFNFVDFFRDDAKVVFDPEVDSWSVTVRMPVLPTAWTPTARDKLFGRLYDHLQQG